MKHHVSPSLYASASDWQFRCEKTPGFGCDRVARGSSFVAACARVGKATRDRCPQNRARSDCEAKCSSGHTIDITCGLFVDGLFLRLLCLFLRAHHRKWYE